MNFCTKCGNKFEKENAFCSKCGFKLDAKNESILGLKTAKETSAKSQEGKGESVDGLQKINKVNKTSKGYNIMRFMKKLLHVFFFGFVSYKFRRLIRTPIILITIGIGVIAIIDFVDRNDFPNNAEIDLVYEKWNNTGNSNLYANDMNRNLFIELLKTDEVFLKLISIQEGEEKYWYLKSRLGIEPINFDSIMIGGLLIISLFITIGLISFLIEPFIVKKKI